MADAQRSFRLNPFSFPPETNTRFTLLIMTAITLLTYVVLMLIIYLAPPSSGLNQLLQNVGAITSTSFDMVQEGDMASFFTDFLLPSLAMMLFIFVVVALLFVAAYLFYLRHPARIRRSKALEPLGSDRYPRMREAVSELSHRVGVDPPPVIEIAASSELTDGQVFGVRGDYSLRLGGRMPLLMLRRWDTFKAIVLHELGHIANGDIGRSYFTRTLWNVVLALTLAAVGLLGLVSVLRLAIALVRTGGLAAALESVSLQALVFGILSLIQLGLTLALVRAIQSGLLRMREFYADWRAVAWGAEAGLNDILRAEAARAPGARPWQAIWDLHPHPQRRLNVIGRPNRLFNVTLDLPLIVGALISLVYSTLTLVIGFILAFTIALSASLLGMAQTSAATERVGVILLGILALILGMLVFLLTILISLVAFVSVGVLVGGTLGLQAQREAAADLALGRGGLTAYLRLLIPAALYALGLEVGFLITPLSFFFAPIVQVLFSGSTPLDLIQIALRMFLWFLAAVSLTWVWLSGVRFFAGRLLGGHVGKSPPRRRRIFLTLWTGVILGVLSVPLMFAHVYVFGESGFAEFLPQSTLIVYTIGALVLTGLVFFIGGLPAFWLIIFRRPACPTCGQTTPSRLALGRQCPGCGAPLAPWIASGMPST